VQNLAEGGPLVTVERARQHSERKLGYDSESESRGCLYWLKKNDNIRKTQKITTY